MNPTDLVALAPLLALGAGSVVLMLVIAVRRSNVLVAWVTGLFSSRSLWLPWGWPPV